MESSTHSDNFKVTLLGTGTPRPKIDRFGASTLIEAGTEKLLFDCGRGTLLRFIQTDTAMSDGNNLFITHLHSDHILSDLPYFEA